jgi:folate-binding protein YgfZ
MEPVADDITIADDVLGPRDVVVVEGADAQTYLHSQLSQDLRELPVGASCWSFVLEPTGKIESLVRVRRAAEERFELDTDAGFGGALRDRIDRLKIRVAADTTLFEESSGSATIDHGARVRLGWPRMGVEIVPGETIPAGTGLTRIAVSYTKGCYPGQELVERMDSRSAEAPKSLRRLVVGAGACAGDPIVDGGAEVGVLTSVAAPHARGWVKRSSDLGEVVQF